MIFSAILSCGKGMLFAALCSGRTRRLFGAMWKHVCSSLLVFRDVHGMQPRSARYETGVGKNKQNSESRAIQRRCLKMGKSQSLSTALFVLYAPQLTH